MPQLLKNNVSGVLSAGINAVATSMTLLDAANFPDPGSDFYLVTLIGLNANGQEAGWEIVRVTAKATNTLTIVRGQEGTSAASWPMATTVQMRLTAASVATKGDLDSHVASTSNPHSVTKAQVGLSNVENTAISTWAGSANLNTLGTVTSGIWNASIIGSAYGGTGVNNGDRTLAVAANSGTLSFSSAASTLTIASSASVSGTNTGDQTISLTGDVTGSGTGSFAATLANSGVTAGTYSSVTVDAKGRVTAGSSPTTLAGYGITDALSNSTTSTQNGYFGDVFLRDDSSPSHYLQITNAADLTGARLLSLNVNDASRAVSLSGDLTVAANATVSGSNTGDQTITLTGDVTGSGTGSFATTLANSGVSAGTYNNSATAVAPFTVDAKGRVTAIGSAVTITPAFASVTGKPTTLSGYGITDAYTKTEVDNLVTGLDMKRSVRAATTANITLSGTQTVDGVALIAGDRVLVKNQSTGAQNGIYVVAAGAWSRATDADTSTEVTPGLYTFVEEGAANADSGWVLVTDAPITIDSTALSFSQFNGLGQVNAGAGLTKSGNTLDIGTASSARIVVNADNIDLATTGVGAGTYRSVSVDAYGRVTAGTNPTTLSGYGIADAQPLDADLTAIAGLAGTSGFLRKTAADSWSLDTNTYLTGNQTISVSGDASGSGATSISLTLANSGVAAGTYTKVTVDAKGRVTTGASLASADLPTYTGTITSSQVTTALGFTPYNSTNPNGYITGINSSMVTSALGYTPYNSSNPSGYITSSASISGNAATATTLQTARTINGTSFNGSQNIKTTEWMHSDRDFAVGTIITTDINYAVSGGDPWILEVRGNSYGEAVPFDIQVQGYIYSDTIINFGGYSNGTNISGLVALNVGGNLVFWFPRQAYWHGYNVRVYTAFATYATNRVSSITSGAKPSGTKEVALSSSIRQSLHSSNYTSYAPSLTGSGASGTWGINITGNAATVTNGLTTSNYNSYAPTLTGGGASGTWSINVTGNAGSASSVAWTNVSGRPTAVSSFTNDSGYLTSSTGVTTTYNTSLNSDSRNSRGVTRLYRREDDSDYSVQTYWTGSYWRLYGYNGDSGHADTHVGYADSAGSAASVAWGNVSSKPSSLMYYQGFTLDANTMDANATGFTYASNAPYTGPVVRFQANGYDLWLNAPYTGGNGLRFRTRNGDNSTLNAWRDVLHDGNYNSYSPTLTGGGASGTWGISITGNAGSASSVAWTNVSGRPTAISAFTNDSGYITSGGRAYPRRSDGGDLNFYWSGQSGQPTWLWGGTDGTNMYVYNPSNFSVNYSTSSGTSAACSGNSATAYGLNVHTGRNNEANKVVRTDGSGYLQVGYINSSSGNENNASSPPRVWGTNGSDDYLRTYQTSSLSVGYATNAGGLSSTSGMLGYSASGQDTAYAAQGGPEVRGQGSGAAMMSFHRPGAYGLNMGLDSDNVFRIGGWSASSNRLQLDMSGNLTVAGNVTAYSDERLKQDWADLPGDFIDRLAGVKHGTYTRVDSGIRQIGVSAQSLRSVAPEGVLDGEYLSVSYGNVALAACVVLAQELVALRAQVAELKGAR